MKETVSRKRQLEALIATINYRPLLMAVIVGSNIVAAVLEGVSATFIIPIIESAQVSASGNQSTFFGYFQQVYGFFGVPFNLRTIIIGAGVAITFRYVLTFVASYYTTVVRTHYIRHVQRQAFESVLDSQISYFDSRGSDEILNTIITEATNCGVVITQLLRLTQIVMVSGVYFALTLLLAPDLTMLTIVLLGGLVYTLRYAFQSGYSLGDKVADANESIQTAVQAGTQGIRDVRLFNIEGEIYTDFSNAIDRFVFNKIRYNRNKIVMEQSYRLVTSLAIFALVYIALAFASFTIAEIGTFLFAMFRLAPRVSSINGLFYEIEANLPHLVRTQDSIEEFNRNTEPRTGEEPAPEHLERLAFENVSFSYDEDDQVLDDVSFAVERDEFVAFVGPSGAGKSTIVSLVTRLYDPDEGEITVNGAPLDALDVQDWRSEIAVVRQNPFIFNDTLRYNVTVGNRDVTQEEIGEACELACVTEFLDDLPDGYDTVLGDDGVRLSGGQRQRVAIARALLTDSELVILDEATSDLDTSLEDEVHRGIESVSDNRTMIVIAHRLSTVVNADCIHVLEDGSLAERGDHDTLLDQNGLYADLYSRQVAP